MAAIWGAHLQHHSEQRFSQSPSSFPRWNRPVCGEVSCQSLRQCGAAVAPFSGWSQLGTRYGRDLQPLGSTSEPPASPQVKGKTNPCLLLALPRRSAQKHACREPTRRNVTTHIHLKLEKKVLLKSQNPKWKRINKSAWGPVNFPCKQSQRWGEERAGVSRLFCRVG